jgi:septin family protein
MANLSSAGSGAKEQPAPQPFDVGILLQVLSIVAAPKAASGPLKQLAAAVTSVANARIELAKLEQAKAKLEADVRSELQAALKADADRMNRDREQATAELARRHQELDEREKQIEQREAEIDQLHAEATELRELWAAKVAELKAAFATAAA